MVGLKQGSYKAIGGIAGYINVSASNRLNDNKNFGIIIGADNVGGIAGYVTMPSRQANVTYTISNNSNANTVIVFVVFFFSFVLSVFIWTLPSSLVIQYSNSLPK